MIKIYSRTLGFANQKRNSAIPRVFPRRKTEGSYSKKYVLFLFCSYLFIYWGKSTFLRRMGPAFLASVSVQDGNPVDDQWSGQWISDGLDAWTFFLSLPGGNQRVIWRSDVYPDIDTGLESSKGQVPRLIKIRIESFPQASTS